MRPSTRSLAQMADRTGFNRSCISLQRTRLLVIPGFAGRQDGVRAVMAALAIQPSMAGRQPVQSTRIFAVLASMAAFAAWFVMPGSTIFKCHDLHRLKYC